MIKVDRGIPIPARTVGRAGNKDGAVCKYPWHVMEIGDSFIFPDKGNVTHAQRCASTHLVVRHRIARRRFTIRTITEDGRRVVRIWRVG
jgi:hypothetical protein